MSTTAQTHRTRKLLESMRRASSGLPAPMFMLMAARRRRRREGEGPEHGDHRPADADARQAVSPVSGMLLMYILSTML